MIKILFVCHGNICRSPMAEFVMKRLVKEKHLEKEFIIQSAATSREELGNPVYPPARKIMAQHGLSCSGKIAVQMTKADYAKYDYIIAMDSMNVRNIMRIIGSDRDSKVSLLMSFTGSSRGVADPWYTGDFDTTYRDVTEGCNALLDHILAQSSK